jgi:hypothetical protein
MMRGYTVCKAGRQDTDDVSTVASLEWRAGARKGWGGLAAEGISWQGLRTKAGSTNATNVDKTFAGMMKSHLFLMAQGEIQRVGVTVLHAAGHYALKHSADLLLHSFDADSHVHVGNCRNSRATGYRGMSRGLARESFARFAASLVDAGLSSGRRQSGGGGWGEDIRFQFLTPKSEPESVQFQRVARNFLRG